MAVKMIGVCFVLLYAFLRVSGITEQEFGCLKGYDPTTNCGNDAKLKEFCNKLGTITQTIDPNEPFLKGYPYCGNLKIKLQKAGGGTVYKDIHLVDCAWKVHHYFFLGKGQAAGTVMNLRCSSGVCEPTKDVPFS